MRSALNTLDQAVTGQQLDELGGVGISCALEPDVDVTSEHDGVSV